MNSLKLAGLALIVAGAIALAYGGFGYTKETDVVKLGPLELTIQEKKSFSVPVWAGLLFIAIGAGLLVAGRKK